MTLSPGWGGAKFLFPMEDFKPLVIEDFSMESKTRSLGTNGGIILPKRDVFPSFTSCIMAALGALTLHSFFELVLPMQGGFTSWAPYLTLFMTVSIVSWRGSIAANGEGLGLSSFVPLLLIASIYLVSVLLNNRLLHQLPDIPKKESKQGLGKAFKCLVSPIFQRRKMVEDNVDASISGDEIIEWAPVLFPTALVLAALFRVSTQRSAIPHQLIRGSVPSSVMVGGCMWVAREVYVTILQRDGVPEDLLGFLIVILVAVLGCQVGLLMQSNQSVRMPEIRRRDVPGFATIDL